MLFGRDSERALLEQLLDTVESGPVACIVEGTPGIGKTTLWRESVENARRRGYQVLDTAPSEPEAVLAFSGLGDLFERTPDDMLDALPDVQAQALKAALFLGELPDTSHELQALPRAILGVLRQLSAAGPTLIAIDDEQWLDPASARVLAFALCRLLRSRVEACRSDSTQAIGSRTEGLLFAARGDLIAAIDAMDTAVAAHLRRRRPFEHGRTLLEKGSIERRAKRKAAAKQTLEQALAILEPLGAQIWVSRARDELSRIGLRRARATEGLTPAQARVAELVAAGSTNAEIARELHMSLRTVESHLSRVYREHGVTSRSQLVAALAAFGSRPFG
jgi:DNA-binding CsgD family transcriptional regulator